MTVRVPPERWARWQENFASRHGAAVPSIDDGRLVLTAPDGAVARVRLPFGREVTTTDLGPLDPLVLPPADWGVLCVRKAGYGIARLSGAATVATKVDRRYVQGRTKAGGQSQQRFARRRDNQARAAYGAAGDRAEELLARPRPTPVLVVGGDRAAIAAVLADPRLTRVAAGRVDDLVPFAEPRRADLDAAIEAARSLRIEVVEPLA